MMLRLANVAVAVLLGAVFSLETTAADLAVCPLEEAMKRLEDYNVYFNAQLATQQIPILQEISRITAKAKNPSLPTGSQLDKADLDRFQQLREQLLADGAREIVSSGYLRDSRVIAQAAKVAHDISQGRKYDEKDPNFFYYSIVMLLSLQHPADHVEITTPKDKECTVEAGLYFYEQLMMGEVNKLSFEEAAGSLKAVAKKYNLDSKQENWAEKIPSLQEKQSAKIDIGTVNRGFQMLAYINNMENLKALNRVSVLGYLSDMEDVNTAHNEAEISRVGTSWTEKAKKYDERTQVLSGMLNLIGQKMPSDAAIQAQGRTKMLQEQGIIPAK